MLCARSDSGNERNTSSHSRDDLIIAPVSIPEQDQAWVIGTSKRKQTRVVQVGRNNRSTFLLRTRNDFGIRGPSKANVGSVNRVVRLIPEPCLQRRRKRHVDKKFHASARRSELNSLVFGQECRVAQRLVDIA